MASTSPNIVMVAGPNGSGKSTSAPALLRDYLGIIEFVNADVIAQGLSGFRVESVAMQAGRIMLTRLRELARQRVDFAFETTLASRPFAPWLRELRDSDYRVHLLFLWLPSPELAVARVATRVQKGGHHVPDETIRRRYHAGLRNFFRLYQSVVDAWILFDNASTEAHKLIALQVEGAEIQVTNQTLWDSIRGQYA